MTPTFFPPFARFRNAAPALAAGLCLLAGACATSAPPPPQQPIIIPPPQPVEPSEPVAPEPILPDELPEFDTGLTPPHMEGRAIVRAAVLLPFSSSNAAARREAASMLNAAELALFERGGESLLMIARDTEGTPSGGSVAARSAIDDGADILIGPLFADAVRSAGRVASEAGVPVIAFSNDRSVAGEGVYLLNFLPETEVRRLAGYIAEQQGVRSIALLGADNVLGRRIADALRDVGASGGPQLYETAFYPPNNFNAATLEIERLARDFQAGAFQALFISDTGGAMRELSAVLSANGLSAMDLTVLGPNTWRTDGNAATVGALRGALVASADTSERRSFEAAYQAAYGDDPTQLASLAYDAMALATQLNGSQSDWEIIERPSGYTGADGLFRLPADGVTERGLAIYELGPGGFTMREPAPTRFTPGF